MSEVTDKLQEDCDKMMERIADVSVSPAEAEELSNKFLGLTYRINNRLLSVKNDLIPMDLSKTLSYSRAFDAIDGKANVSKAKAMASADKTHMTNTAKMTKKENERDYWKGTFDIFMAGHVFYKHLTRN